MPQTLPCENGAGSINNPDGSRAQTGLNTSALATYAAPTLDSGTWQISGLTQDVCAANDQTRQETYVAEQLNISGAPINLFKMLGVHEQGNGSVLSQGSLFSSTSYPGYPLSGINSGSSSWKSSQVGSAIAGFAYIGIDFGVKTVYSGESEYDPQKSKWTSIGSISITQANTPNEYARQVKVEISDGSCEATSPIFTGTGDGTIAITVLGPNVSQGMVRAIATSPTSFSVSTTLANGSILNLGVATIGSPFQTTYASFTINQGVTSFASGDMFSFQINYVWKRLGMYNLIQSPLPQTLNFKHVVTTRAVRVTPTMFTGSGSWEVISFDITDTVPTDINNIQDLFFNENRDRDYALEPTFMKAMYSPADSMSDLSRFGLSILDSYSFTVSFATMVSLIGRPIVVGDIVEVIPELQYDQNLRPVRKFLEVTDTGWASEGFSTSWRPTVYRFSAAQALPSQETRDIFGTIDTQKYLVADSILSDGIGEQIDDTPLTQTEEIITAAANKVPETGSADGRELDAVKLHPIMPPSNAKGQPPAAGSSAKPNLYIEDGLPKDGQPFTEGYKLPDVTTATDGEYYRLNYPAHLKLPPRLYRFSMVKNRWLYLETDRRGDYSSHKPSVRNILQSPTNQALSTKV
jgi:hypothetical protein